MKKLKKISSVYLRYVKFCLEISFLKIPIYLGKNTEWTRWIEFFSYKCYHFYSNMSHPNLQKSNKILSSYPSFNLYLDIIHT